MGNAATVGGDASAKWVSVVAFSWGLCAFFPVGVMYLHLCLMLTSLVFSGGLKYRLRKVNKSAFFLPLIAMLVWTSLAAAVGGWFPDSATRLFHTFRVALVLSLGIMLTASEARAALGGFLTGAVLAASIVCAHHLWGMPDWAIWNGLLSSRNNFSSGNMITLATASGVCFLLGLSQQLTRNDRWLALAAALALGVTVAFHAVSRNSQLLVVLLILTAIFCRFRSLRSALAGLAAVVFLVTSLWYFSPTTISRFVQLAANLQSATEQANYGSSGGVRWRMYQEAVHGMLEHPLLGMGVGSWLPHWHSVWLAIEDKVPPESKHAFSEINNPHNDFLLAGMETGVAGMLILVWLLARFVSQGWRQHSAAGGITVIMGVAMFADASVNAPFRDAALGMTLLWLLGVSAAAHRPAGP